MFDINIHVTCSYSSSQSAVTKKSKSKKRSATSTQEGPTTSKQIRFTGSHKKKDKSKHKKDKIPRKKNKKSKTQTVSKLKPAVEEKESEPEIDKYTISKNLRSNLEAEVIPGIPYYPETKRSRSLSGNRSRDRKSSFNSLEDIKLKVVSKSVESTQGTRDIQVDIPHTSVQNQQTSPPKKSKVDKKKRSKDRRSSSTSSKSLSPELDSLRRNRRSKTGSCASSR